MIHFANGLDEPRKQEDAIEIWMRSIREQHNKPLFRYALALTCSVDDAQDVVQEVFANVSANYHRFMEVTNQKAYLFRATRNSSFSILRKRKRSAALHDAICADLAAICMPHAKDMSVTIISIRSAFDQISIDQREVLVLKILSQLTFKEIAEASGTSINTVAARYKYGIEKLRQALGVNELGHAESGK